jgi:hypothetical protein
MIFFIYYAAHYARCQALMRVIFNASQKRNQAFSRKNDCSRASLYLGVPVSLLQHKYIRDF